MDDGRPYLDYLLNFRWNSSKYRTEARPLVDLIESFTKEVSSIDNAQRNKGSQYALTRGQLTSALRKKTGNLSIRSLSEVVSAEDFSETVGSEYLLTVLVAVPKNLVKEWEASYERLSSMVVPRSSKRLAQDDEFTLFGVVVFRKVQEEFAQKCRENKFIVRDFTYDEEAITKQRDELAALEVQEKEQWSDLLRLSRINFAELFQILVHVKLVRAYIESVLRYGLPAAYFAAIVQPDPKQVARLVPILAGTINPAGSGKAKKASKGDDSSNAPVGEYATVLEGEYLEFVLFEIERVQEQQQ